MTKSNSLVKVIKILILGFITGLLISMVLRWSGLTSNLENLSGVIFKNSYLILIFSTIISITICIIFYYLGKKKVIKQLENNTEIIEDDLLTLTLTLCNIGVFLVLTIGGIFATSNFLKEINIAQILIALIILISAPVVFVMIQKKIVDFVKSYSPEKRGNVFDLAFNKDWIDSSDEREKFEIYKAGYKSYENTKLALIGAMILLNTFSKESEAALLPFVVLFLVFLISEISYFYEFKKR